MKVGRHIQMVLGSYDQSAHEGIARFAGEHNWHLDVSILKDFQLPEHWRGDGIITSLNNSRLLEDFILKADVPTVDLSIWREDIELPRVAADNTAIGRLGADHFISLGHTCCAWFGLANNPVSMTRQRAYAARLAEVGLECIRLDTVKTEDPSYITDRLLALPKPCAVYTKSDYDSAWIANLCFVAGLRVPEEVAILGADDNRLICENQRVPLSSVRYDLKRIGYEGAALLNTLLEGASTQSKIRLVPPSGISVRQSTDALAVRDPLIRSVLEYLKKHYSRSMGTMELSDVFKVSRRQLETKFRASMRSSIREHLIWLRLTEAKRLLIQTLEPIETIAAVTGFCHAPHFSTTFRKHMGGVTPREFRRSRGQGQSQSV